jgi:hypothetical protein
VTMVAGGEIEYDNSQLNRGSVFFQHSKVHKKIKGEEGKETVALISELVRHFLRQNEVNLEYQTPRKMGTIFEEDTGCPGHPILLLVRATDVKMHACIFLRHSGHGQKFLMFFSELFLDSKVCVQNNLLDRGRGGSCLYVEESTLVAPAIWLWQCRLSIW